MGAKQITPQSAVGNYLKQQLERREKAILNAYFYVGENCLIEARTGGTYTDRTGNLRNSIGYKIVKDGKIIGSGGFDGQEGKKGEALAMKIVKKFPKGIALIVTTGVNYAGYVSAMGYNVLDSSELLAKKLIPQMMKQLGFTVK